MTIVKFLDLFCKKCGKPFTIRMKDFIVNQNTWHGAKCPNCKTYNDMRFRKVPFYGDEETRKEAIGFLPC